ncbi:hypothetical protein B0H16DRAFT_170208 [Mycena metata]|uniref:Uncharacterized protein n=1 Tax=Mycena metata TaxID=1033252 RepID=A0AAD7JV89_9AGAR|nr:hypothetical protein B0H16DRAFT_170208 [Mycena metata]
MQPVSPCIKAVRIYRGSIPPSMHLLLYALSVLLLYFSHTYAAVQGSCACSPVTIPVHVDVLVPKDPTDEFAGLKSNASELRRVDATYDIYGIFCEPDTTVSSRNKVQLILLVTAV